MHTEDISNQDKWEKAYEKNHRYENVNIIGNKVREARIRRTQPEAALRKAWQLMAVYTCRGSVSRIENGKRAVTDIEIDAISKVLGVSLDYLFGRQ